MKTILMGGLAALGLAAASLPAVAQDVEFTLYNQSPQALHYFYTSPSNDNSWGDDLLGPTGTLQPGEAGNVFIGDGSDQCLYDFSFEMEDGSQTEVYEVDICQLNSYTLY